MNLPKLDGDMAQQHGMIVQQPNMVPTLVLVGGYSKLTEAALRIAAGLACTMNAYAVGEELIEGSIRIAEQSTQIAIQVLARCAVLEQAVADGPAGPAE